MSAGDIRISYPTVVRTYNLRMILVHYSRAGSMAFDIFCPGDYPVDPCAGMDSYEVPDCPWVKRMVEKGYVYRCSGDLNHISEINAEVARWLNKLVWQDGFTVEFAEEGWE
jgi:hypothetical protein